MIYKERAACDFLWPGGPCFKDEAEVFRLCTDSVLLAYFAGSSLLKKKKRAIDLGCGSGVLSILISWHTPGLLIDSVDINPGAVRLTDENAELSGVSDNIRAIEGDLRRHREFLQPGSYDLTITNPPYYSPGSGKRAISDHRAAARSEELCSLDDMCTAAGYLTRWGGSFMLVHKPERLADIFRALNNAGFEPKRIRFVQHKQSTPPSLVLIESRRGGKPSLKVESPLLLANDDGTDSDEVRSIYHRKKDPEEVCNNV